MVIKLYVNFQLSLLSTFLGSVKISLYNEKQFLISRDSLSCPDCMQPGNEDFPINNSVLALPELYTNDNETFKNTLLLLSKEFCQMDLDKGEWEKNELGWISGKTGLSFQPPMNTTLLSFSHEHLLCLLWGWPTFPLSPGQRGLLHTDCQFRNWGHPGPRMMRWSPAMNHTLGSLAPGEQHPATGLEQAQQPWLLSLPDAPTPAWNFPWSSLKPNQPILMSPKEFVPLGRGSANTIGNPWLSPGTHHVVFENLWILKYLSALTAGFIFRAICHGDIPISWFHTSSLHQPRLSHHWLQPASLKYSWFTTLC